MLTPRMSSGSSTGRATTLRPSPWRNGGSVGQVVFALGVAGVEPGEGLPEAGELEDVAARVHLADRRLLGPTVALFDDAEEMAGGVAEDAAEPGRIGYDGPCPSGRRRSPPAASPAGRPEARGGRAARRRRGRRRGRRSRPGAAGRHARRRRSRAGSPGWRTGRRGSLARASRTCSAPNPTTTMIVRAPAASGGVDDVADHGLTADLVQHLGQARPHPLAVPRRQDDRHRDLASGYGASTGTRIGRRSRHDSRRRRSPVSNAASRSA